MTLNGDEAEDIWADFQHQATHGLSPTRRAALPPDDPRYAPLSDPNTNTEETP